MTIEKYDIDCDKWREIKTQLNQDGFGANNSSGMSSNNSLNCCTFSNRYIYIFTEQKRDQI